MTNCAGSLREILDILVFGDHAARGMFMTTVAGIRIQCSRMAGYACSRFAAMMREREGM